MYAFKYVIFPTTLGDYPETVVVEGREVYGKKLFYPVNDPAKLLAEIAGTKTLGESVLKKAEDLGLEVALYVDN